MSRFIRAAALLATATVVGAGPPPTPKVDYAERLFGMTFEDPYHWMEAGGPKFDAWLSAQGAYARETLDGIPGRARLLEQLQRLDSDETWVGGAVLSGGQWIYSKTRPQDPIAKIFVRPATGGVERILIDPATFDADGQVADINYWSISPGGRYIAYGISLGGTEIGTLRIRRVDTGVDLSDKIPRTRYARPNWLDDTSFLYSGPSAATQGSAQRQAGRVLLHRLGTDAAADVAIFGPGLIAGAELPTDFIFRGLASPESSVVVGEYDAGLSSSPEVLFTAAKQDLGPTSIWHQVARFEDDVRGVVLHGDMLYLRTARDAPRQRIVRMAAHNSDLANAETVVAEGTATIRGMVAAADALYVQLDEGGFGRLLRVPWGGAPEPVPPPFDGSFISLSASANVPGIVLRMQGWTRSQTVFAYDPVARRFVDTGLAPPSPVAFDDIELTEVRAPAADGAMVPLSIIAPRYMIRDGHHPVLLYAYGAYGVVLGPAFSAMRRAWFDSGGIYVVAHVRGSGGFGEEWHRAGKLESKVNSVTDFIACADYLVRNGWATAKTLSAMGASAGGIVVGGAIAARPELFNAAIIQVGIVNALRLEQIPIGPFNTGEFGSTDTEEGVRMLYAIDAYQQLREGVDYPGVIIATGRNDTRVSPWMPAKFAARLQAVTRGHPALLRVEDTGGHFGGTKLQVEEEVADYYAFLLWQASVSGFQPVR